MDCAAPPSSVTSFGSSMRQIVRLCLPSQVFCLSAAACRASRCLCQHSPPLPSHQPATPPSPAVAKTAEALQPATPGSAPWQQLMRVSWLWPSPTQLCLCRCGCRLRLRAMPCYTDATRVSVHQDCNGLLIASSLNVVMGSVPPRQWGPVPAVPDMAQSWFVQLTVSSWHFATNVCCRGVSLKVRVLHPKWTKHCCCTTLFNLQRHDHGVLIMLLLALLWLGVYGLQCSCHITLIV